MKTIAANLEALLDQFRDKLKAISEEEFNRKPGNKWSKKEELGHCIDSAENNIRRFIVAQYENEPRIVYQQDFWVKANNYQECNTADLIGLWYYLNKQIVSILNNTPSDKAQVTCKTGEVHTIEWLAQDYVKHMQHHLHHLLTLDPIPYP